MKIKFNLDDDLTRKKVLELYNIVIAIRSAFHEDCKDYPHTFLYECLNNS